MDTLESGLPSTGVGGQAATRTIEAVLTIDSFSTPLTLAIVETSRPIPSPLGRDVISLFALFMEERTGRVLLLEPAEAETRWTQIQKDYRDKKISFDRAVEEAVKAGVPRPLARIRLSQIRMP